MNGDGLDAAGGMRTSQEAFAGTGPVRSQVIVGGVVQGGDRHPQHSVENF